MINALLSLFSSVRAPAAPGGADAPAGFDRALFGALTMVQGTTDGTAGSTTGTAPESAEGSVALASLFGGWSGRAGSGDDAESGEHPPSARGEATEAGEGAEQGHRNGTGRGSTVASAPPDRTAAADADSGTGTAARVPEGPAASRAGESPAGPGRADNVQGEEARAAERPAETGRPTGSQPGGGRSGERGGATPARDAAAGHPAYTRAVPAESIDGAASVEEQAGRVAMNAAEAAPAAARQGGAEPGTDAPDGAGWRSARTGIETGGRGAPAAHEPSATPGPDARNAAPAPGDGGTAPRSMTAGTENAPLRATEPLVQPGRLSSDPAGPGEPVVGAPATDSRGGRSADPAGAAMTGDAGTSEPRAPAIRGSSAHGPLGEDAVAFDVRTHAPGPEGRPAGSGQIDLAAIARAYREVRRQERAAASMPQPSEAGAPVGSGPAIAGPAAGEAFGRSGGGDGREQERGRGESRQPPAAAPSAAASAFSSSSATGSGSAAPAAPPAPVAGPDVMGRAEGIDALRELAESQPTRRVTVKVGEGPGATRVRVSLRGDAVRADMASESELLTARLARELPELGRALSRQGLEVESLRVRGGEPLIVDGLAKAAESARSSGDGGSSSNRQQTSEEQRHTARDDRRSSRENREREREE